MHICAYTHRLYDCREFFRLNVIQLTAQAWNEFEDTIVEVEVLPDILRIPEEDCEHSASQVRNAKVKREFIRCIVTFSTHVVLNTSKKGFCRDRKGIEKSNRFPPSIAVDIHGIVIGSPDRDQL